MGILSAFRLIRAAGELSPTLAGAPGTGSRVGIRSPWSSTQLSTVVLGDIFGIDAMPVTRAEAMSVPAVVKARHLICTTLARHPLRVFEGSTMLDEQPAWLDSTGTQTHPNTRMLWTLDDLVFAGWSLWAVERAGSDKADPITDAVRVPPEWWQFNGAGEIEVGSEPAEDGSVILFSGPFEGLLEAAATTIRGARDIERAWVGRVRSPIPAIDLHQTTDEQLEDDEIEALIDAWASARRDPEGAIAYTPHNIQANALGTEGSSGSSALFVEGRNAVRLDVANFTGLPAALLDGSMATASLTYSTTEGKRNEFADYSVGMWSDPIESRLSMDDVLPTGQRMAFDLSAYLTPTQPTTSPARED